MQRLASYQLVYVLLFLPFILFFREAFLPIFVALLALPIFWQFYYGRLLPSTPFNLSIFCLFLSILTSLWVTPDLASSLRKVVALFYSFLLFFTVVAFVKLYISYLWYATAITLFFGMSLVAVGFLAMLSFVTARLPQLVIVSPNPNELAGVITYCLFLLLPIAIMLNADPPPIFRRGYLRLLGILLMLGSGLVIFALYMTHSRGGWISAITAVSLLVVFFLRRPLSYIVTFATAIGAIIGGWWLFSNELLVDNSRTSISLADRIEIWSRAIYALQEFPYTGVGMNMFREVVHALYPLFTIDSTVDLGHAHNHLLQAGVDLGVPGMIAYLSLWIGSAVLLWQAWHSTDDTYLRTLTAGLSASLIAHFTFGIVDAIALGARPNFLLWMLFGLVVGVHHHTALGDHPSTPNEKSGLKSAQH